MSEKAKRILTDEEIADYRKGFSELALEALEKGDLEKAKEICRREHETHNMNHDLFIKEITHLYSIIYDKLGEEASMDAVKEVTAFSASPYLLNLRTTDIKGWITWCTDMWKQHNPHPDTIVEEDDEKIIMRVQCGSGGMLVAEGMYEGPNGFHKFETPTTDTWMETGLPLYCAHCHNVHEVIPIREIGQGAQYWMHESPFPRKPGDRCVHLVYKDARDIPEKYYDRLGIKKDNDKAVRMKSEETKGNRILSGEFIDDCRKGFSEMAMEAIDNGDIEKAKKALLREHETHNMNHDLFIKEIANLYSIIYDKLGEQACMDAIKEVTGFSAWPELIELRTTDLKGWITWCTDMWRQHNPHPDTIVEEDDEKITLRIKCGSGGMLIDEGVYDGPDGFHKFETPTADTWMEPDLPLYCAHCHYVHELIPIKAAGQGSQFWVHESPFPKNKGDRCVHIVYKDPKAIPEKYYEKLGLAKEV